MKMKSLLLSMLFMGIGGVVCAQDTPVDYSRYPDYSPVINPDRSFYTYGEGPMVNIHNTQRLEATSQRPDHLDNSQRIYFPPVFNQAGGSCGSASRICYMFTWELNAYRNLNGKDPRNYYPSHFVWLLTNGNSGKDQFVQFVGVPSAATYGGQTTSSIYGWYDTANPEFGWMQGYDKWFEAMHNRMLAPSHIPASVGSEEGREFLKNWLWNHNGDNDFYAGGVAGIGVASGGQWLKIPVTEANRAAGVAGKYYVGKWGTQVDHALTIVGYDDRIEFDLDGNGVAGERDKDEVGAWIIVNSWGAGWCNQGFIYCPYKHAVTAFTGDGRPNGSYYAPEIYRVRKDYRPERTIKLRMDYNRRSELKLSAGISTNLNATKPDVTIPFYHFQYSGDGNYGNTNPAPEVPMLGRWADGKLHDEPMEFGYDLTDLTANADRNKPIKYFFIIETKSWAQGSGHIYEASIMDYNLDSAGLEIPFDGVSADSPVEIQSNGKQTIISVVVQGDGYADPRNVALDESGKLTWDEPARTGRAIARYNVYRDGVNIGNTTSKNYQLASVDGYVYGVTAVYSDGHESRPTTVHAPVVNADVQTAYEFSQAGFSIPNVFSNTFQECTIEFLIRPKSLKNWNQSAGPGWGTFMMHANEDGRFTAGWNTSDRVNSSTTLSVGTWSHVAIVVKKKVITIYINGTAAGSYTSNNYSGLGGFGDFVFTANSGNNSYTDALIDEVRIWDHARTSTQITKNKYAEFSGQMLPDGLLAYYKGGVMARNGKYYMIDVAGGNHAEVLGSSNFRTTTENTRNLSNPSETTKLTIDKLNGTYVAGQAVPFTATVSSNINHLVWSCAEAGIANVASMSPSLTFPRAGQYTVKVVGTTYKDETVEAERVITIGETESVDAEFTIGKDVVAAGEPVALMVTNPVSSHIYEWTLEGARETRKGGSLTGATYDTQGTYTITLKVSSPDGKTATSSRQITVRQVAPLSNFRITPTVILKGERTYLIDESRQGPTNWQWKISSAAQTYIVNGRNSSLTPTVPGVYDIELTTSNEVGQHTYTQGNALYVCNADSKNGMSMIGYPTAQVTARNPLPSGGNGFTIEFWLEVPSLGDQVLGIGDENGTIKLEAYSYGGMVLYVGGKDMNSGSDYILTNGWHHYAITYQKNGNVYFYRDGERFLGSWINQTSVPEMSRFRIGGSDLPFAARIDELRVWNKALTQSEIREVCVAPIEDVAAAQDNGLQLYYDFNQSGGNVEDRTSNHNNGVRTGFGPDGDAWGLSQGVFALNFETATSTDVTSQYLSNYRKSFSYTATRKVNNSVANRFYEIKNWTLENTVVNGSVTTGVHVDAQKSYCMTCTVGWDGFANELSDHKAFQTITLPAGVYTLKVDYDSSYEGQCGNSYIVVAAGNTLTNTADLSQAIAYKQMDAKTSAITSNELTFALAEETEVSLGLLINQSGKICMCIERFTLTRGGATILDANNELPDAINQIDEDNSVNRQGVYDLQGRRIAQPTRAGIYIINGRKTVVR